MQTLLQDLRYGIRMLLKSKAFALVTIFSLALGIGANTALFSVMDAVLLKSLPVSEPDQLVLLRWTANNMEMAMSGSVWQENGKETGNILPWPIYLQFRSDTKTLESICAFAPLHQVNANVNGLAEVVQGQIVTGNYHATLGVKPVLGRLLAESDDQVSAEPAVVISHRYWQRRFAGDPGVLGKQISLNKKSFTVIGVTPPEFYGALNVGYAVDLTVPMTADLIASPMSQDLKKPDFFWLSVMGRLKPGVTQAQAQDELSTIGNPLLLATQTKPMADADKPRLVLDPGKQGIMEARRDFSTPLRILLYVVIAALFIACLNIANLTLARAATRQKEMAVRLATGATRWRLIRQLLTESVVVSLLGGTLGILFAIWTKDLLLTFSGSGRSELAIDVHIDWRVLAFTACVAILTGILFGLVPAWRASRVNLASDLKENSHQATFTNTRITKGFLVAQIALSLTLLIGAGLFLRTLRNLENVNIGFAQENLLLFKVQPELSGYKDDNVSQLYTQISERIESLPGVRAVTHSLMPMIGGGGFFMPLKLAGGDPQARNGSWIHHVRPNFFEALQVSVLAGRSLSAQDTPQSQKVAVLNQAAAKKFFGNENPVGKFIGIGRKTNGNEIEIIGVVSDVKYSDLRKDAPPTTYLSAIQFTEHTSQQANYSIRLERGDAGLVAAIRGAVKQVDANLPVTDIATQAEKNARTYTHEKLFAQLTTFFGLLTLGLVSIGLYGMMSYSVAQRQREMGIRLALGAQAGDLLRMVLRQGLIVVILGILGGGVLAWASSRLLTSYMFGVSVTNPLVIGFTVVMLLMVALLACLIPARRAAKTDPIVALRCE